MIHPLVSERFEKCESMGMKGITMRKAKSLFSFIANMLIVFLLLFMLTVCIGNIRASLATEMKNVSDVCELRTIGCTKRKGMSCPEDKSCKPIDGVCDCFEK